MENKFSVNQPIEAEAVEVPQEQVVHQPKIHLEDLDTYKTVVAGLRLELGDLIQDGHMTESVAERVINDFMYTAFTQIVKLQLR